MKTLQSPAPVAGEEDAPPASAQPVEAIGAGREVRTVIVKAIAFLNRDVGTDRLTNTVAQLLPEFEKADALLRAATAAPKAWYIESKATPGECWELIEGREPTEYVGDEAFTITPLWTDAALSPASPARTPMGGEVESDHIADPGKKDRVYPRRIDVAAALAGQVRDDPNYSRLTIDQCAVQTRAAVQALCVSLDWARAGDAEKAALYAEDALRLLEGAPERVAKAGKGIARMPISQALAASSPSPAQGGIAQIVTGYRNMGPDGDKDAAIQHLCDLLSASPQPEAGEEDPSHHQVWTQERGWEHPTPPSVQPVKGK